MNASKEWKNKTKVALTLAKARSKLTVSNSSYGAVVTFAPNITAISTIKL